MIPQQAIQKEAENSALENSEGCREGAHCFDCFCRAHEEGFIAAASWFIEQYRPLIEALEKFIIADPVKEDCAQLYELMEEEFNKLKQHT